MYLKVLTE